MNHNQENIKQSVLTKIRDGKVKMRPRAYFWAQVVTVLVVASFALLTSALAVSFIFFSIHESGELFLLGFGWHGLSMLVTLFPWTILTVAVALIVLLEWLLRHFKFNYRVPILKMFFIALLLVTTAGLLLATSPLHQNLLRMADGQRLPIFGGMYENIRTPHEDRGEFRGVVMAVGTSTLTISHNDNDFDADDGTRTVLLPPNLSPSEFHIGDRVYIAGEIEGASTGTISAYGANRF